MRKTAIFRSDLFIAHDPGFDHMDSPDRLINLYRDLDQIWVQLDLIEPEFSKVSRETLLLNHTENHVDKVAATAEKVYSVLDEDTFTSKKSYEAACLAAGALTTGVDLLMNKSIDNGLALVRPPGHHGEPDHPMGFCLFNNVAVAAHHAIKEHGLKRILLIDWDVHHGNGSQNSFYETDTVFYISIHQSSLFPGTGHVEETGRGRGEGYNLNIPLPGGQGDAEYANIFNTLILPIATEYNPELILISAGFDGYHADEASTMRLTHQGYSYMARRLVNLAEQLCEGKILVTLEGGYDTNGLREGVFAVLSELLGEKLKTTFPSSLDENCEKELRKEIAIHPAIERVRDVAKKYWKM